MFNNILSTNKVPHLIQGSTPEAIKKPIIRKYHKYFRQRDTLKDIPKELEEYVQQKDETSYNKSVQEAAERLAALGESRTETLPIYDKDYGLTKVVKDEEEVEP